MRPDYTSTDHFPEWLQREADDYRRSRVVERRLTIAAVILFWVGVTALAAVWWQA